MTASRGAKSAANYIAEEFRKAGVVPPKGFSDYFIPFQVKPLPLIDHNVIGVLPGTDSSEIVIFSAHYDHIGTAYSNPYEQTPKGQIKYLKDSIYNGANDNASGTAALISLARYFGNLKNNKRTIVFAAFSGEELGMLGSSAFLASISNPGSISCMINFDMLGRGSAPFITGSSLGNLQLLLNKELSRIDRNRFGKRFFKSEPSREESLFTRSDNYPFAEFRVPAHSIMVTSDQDRYYHTIDDEASTLNYSPQTELTLPPIESRTN
jgi:Zn-dependent M28 family amino/carboxypeptidase